MIQLATNPIMPFFGLMHQKIAMSKIVNDWWGLATGLSGSRKVPSRSMKEMSRTQNEQQMIGSPGPKKETGAQITYY